MTAKQERYFALRCLQAHRMIDDVQALSTELWIDFAVRCRNERISNTHRTEAVDRLVWNLAHLIVPTCETTKCSRVIRIGWPGAALQGGEINADVTFLCILYLKFFLEWSYRSGRCTSLEVKWFKQRDLAQGSAICGLYFYQAPFWR